MTELISLDRFRGEARAAKEHGETGPEAAVLRVSLGDPQPVAERTFRFCFSDGSVDRYGDTIAAAGWVVDSFLKNPVALWAHDSSAPPIGRASKVAVEGDRLMGDIEFAPAEIYPFAETIYRLVKEKFICAVSVGFRPLEYAFAEGEGREWGIDFERQELLEISVVPVPANANALLEARARGIEIRPLVEWAERTLEWGAGGGKVFVPRSELEQLRRLSRSNSEAATGHHEEKLGMALDENGVRRDGGMAEGDPPAGGFIANCGRAVSGECGMKDPTECAVHGPALVSGDAKSLLAWMKGEIRSAIRLGSGCGG